MAKELKKYTLQDLPDKLWNSCMDEQETLISFSRGDEDIEIYTTDNVMFNKIKKLLQEEDSEYSIISIGYLLKGEEEKDNIEGNRGEDDQAPVSTRVASSLTVRAPLRCLSLRAGKKREMSEEQREELRERMKSINKR